MFKRAAEPQPLVGYIEQTVVEQVPEPPVPLDHRHRAHRLQPNRRGALRQEDAATEREREHEAVVEDLEPPRDEMALGPGREREERRPLDGRHPTLVEHPGRRNQQDLGPPPEEAAASLVRRHLHRRQRRPRSRLLRAGRPPARIVVSDAGSRTACRPRSRHAGRGSRSVGTTAARSRRSRAAPRAGSRARRPRASPIARD